MSLTSNFLYSAIPGIPNVPLGIQLRMAFEEANTAEEFVGMLPQTFSMRYHVSDRNNLFAAEVTPSHKIVQEIKNTVIGVNMFFDEELKPYDLDLNDSPQRLVYVEEQLEKVFYDFIWIQYTKKQDILDILSYKPLICKCLPESEIITVGYFLSYGETGIFGLGNPADTPHGICPF